MRGIHFLINETGHKTAAIVDLRVHGERWHEIKRLLEHPSAQELIETRLDEESKS